MLFFYFMKMQSKSSDFFKAWQDAVKGYFLFIGVTSMAAGYTPTAFAEAKSAPLPERGAEDGIQRREQPAVLESVSRCVGYIGGRIPGACSGVEHRARALRGDVGELPKCC